MSKLYSRLSRVGLSRAFVRRTALPQWWDDSLAENPSGRAQMLLLLSRHLGLDLASLQADDAPVRLRVFGPCKYKKRANVTQDELALARVVATRAAQLAASAVSIPFVGVPEDAGEIRRQILDAGKSWVGLPESLEYCWSIGIPVLHLDHFPVTAKRPDGFAASVNGRPVIILCKKSKYSAWLLFVLAHELGHLALGHVPEGGALIDQGLHDDDPDSEERQANSFATELLTGSPDQRFVAAGRWLNAVDLAKEARAIGRQMMIDPGHVALNYAHSMGNSFYTVGNAALRHLEPHRDAVSTIRAKMAENLDWSLLPEDSCDFLMRVTQHVTHE